MATRTQQQPKDKRAASHPIYLNEGLSPKKTAIIIVTVVGCIAILWPKVFYPMMFGAAPVKQNLKEQRGPGALRQERPAHLHPESIYQAMRERGRAIPQTQTVPIVERKSSPSNPPPRIVEGRPGPIPGMRPPMGAGALHQPQQKGSSMGFIMPLYTIGIIVFFGYTIMKLAFKQPVPNAPYGPAPTDPNFRKEVFGQENGRHVEDLNGTKLGTTNQPDQSKRNASSELYNASLSAASVATNLSTSLKQHQQYQQQQAQSTPSAAALALQQQQQQRRQQIQQQHLDYKASLLGFNKESEQLMEIEKLRKKLEDTERAMAKLIAEMNSDQFEAKQPFETTTTTGNVENISNGHTNTTTTPDEHTEENTKEDKKDVGEEVATKEQASENQTTAEAEESKGQRNKRESSTDRSVTVLGMEITASCEGGQKWSKRPPTPVFLSHSEHSKSIDDFPEPQSIYLEGTLPHESQILVADAETTTEQVYDKELNGSPEEPAVVLSSKMTLSLINLDSPNEQNDNENSKSDVESPLADDIEIIGHEEH